MKRVGQVKNKQLIMYRVSEAIQEVNRSLRGKPFWFFYKYHYRNASSSCTDTGHKRGDAGNWVN